MKPLFVASALVVASAELRAQSLSGDAARSFADFQQFGPQRAFVLSGDGRTFWYAGAGGSDPSQAIAAALKACTDQGKDKGNSQCTVYAVNDILLNGRDWRSAAPAPAPAIGRLRGQPWWQNRGPQAAAGLVVWSHGYRSGSDSTNSAPQPWIGRFTSLGYDLYRFDREWIRDWAGDATQLADAVRQAKAMGYRRVLLAGQSAGAWVSLAAALRGAPVDGVISISAAHHGEVKDMRDVSIARAEWQQIVRGIRPGPRLVLVNFAGDPYDVGGRMEDATAAFAQSGVQADIIANPPGYSGHNAGSDFAFTRKYGTCIQTFIETGVKQLPC
jgi:pimeloyl-ACP methyl ester carboxylesterase